MQKIKEHIVEIIVGIAMVLLVIGVIAGAMEENKVWNNGYCTCDGKWQYLEPVRRTYRSDDSTQTSVTYIYKCDRCGKVHEFSVLR